jgi:predicted MFS family arabinose efflux permease
MRVLKAGYFTLEGLNSFATVYFFYYFYFFTQHAYGFSNAQNLALAAVNGAVYAVASWLGGRFAQRFGYITALRAGFLIMMAALLAGAAIPLAAVRIAALIVTVAGQSLTWPALEALVSEGESSAGVQHMVGTYNMVWAGTGALAYFVGGAVLDKLGFLSLFYVPVAVQGCQFALTFWLERHARHLKPPPAPALRPVDVTGGAEFNPVAAPGLHSPARARSFLRMAWLANPFAYIAINTLIAVMPGLAGRLHLSTTMAGFTCSLWCFVRLFAFAVLWVWPGWHYRFRWLLTAYIALIASFAFMLMVPGFAVLIGSQVLFGAAIGLIYYSSLFYSMHGSDAKGEHGGIHEAAIGLGNCAGPAVGAASLYLLPQYANSGAVAVSVLLLAGLAGLAGLWRAGHD